jgi:hypothetical protein
MIQREIATQWRFWLDKEKASTAGGRFNIEDSPGAMERSNRFGGPGSPGEQ